MKGVKDSNVMGTKTGKGLPFIMTIGAVAFVFLIIYLPTIPSILGSSNEEELADVSTKEQVLHTMKEIIHLGMDMATVSGIFGDNYIEVSPSTLWRYDFGTKGDYNYHYYHEYADLDGINNEVLDVQLFLAWTAHGTLESFSAVYKTEEEKELLEYKLLPNGEVQEKPVFLTDEELFYLSPPSIVLLSENGQRIPSELGSYTWTRKVGGRGQSVHVDTAPPIEIAEYMNTAIVDPESIVTIEFVDYSHPELEAYIWEWDSETVWLLGSRVGEIPIKEETITLPEKQGEYVIEIYARWENGEGSYTLNVEVKE